MFDPKTHRYPYPKDTSAHYLVVKKDNGTVFDRNYPYVDRSKGMRFKQAVTRLLLNVFVFHVARVRLGLRVKGRENLKKHREALRNGAVSCSNHVHLWDFIAVMYALRPHKPYVMIWDKNVRGENGTLMRLVRGIPIPQDDVHATAAMAKDVAQVLDGGFVHVYGEGSMWEYYQPIRPFKDGFAYFAVRNGKPVLPLAFSYRRPGWIRRKIFRQIALFTLTVGEPIFPDGTLRHDDRIKDLIVRTHDAVCRLAGIDPGENVYPPVYDRSERVDYYDQSDDGDA